MRRRRHLRVSKAEPEAHDIPRDWWALSVQVMAIVAAFLAGYVFRWLQEGRS